MKEEDGQWLPADSEQRIPGDFGYNAGEFPNAGVEVALPTRALQAQVNTF